MIGNVKFLIPDHQLCLIVLIFLLGAWSEVWKLRRRIEATDRSAHYIVMARAERLAVKLKREQAVRLDHEDIDGMVAVGEAYDGGYALIMLGLELRQTHGSDVVGLRWRFNDSKPTIKATAARVARLLAMDLIEVRRRLARQAGGDESCGVKRPGRPRSLELGLTQHGKRIMRTGNALGDSNVPARFYAHVSKAEAFYTDGDMGAAHRELWINVVEPFFKWAIKATGRRVMESSFVREVWHKADREQSRRQLDIGGALNLVDRMPLGYLIRVMNDVGLLPSNSEDRPSLHNLAKSIVSIRNAASHHRGASSAKEAVGQSREFYVGLCLVKSFLELCANQVVDREDEE